MKKLYNKNELGFSLAFIGIYVVLFSFSDMISEQIGIEKAITAVSSFALSLVLLIFIRRQGLNEKYGLIKPERIKRNVLFIIIFLFMIAYNLKDGFHINYNLSGTVCYIISMLFVGLIEEVIFRGFLFKAIYKESPGFAVVISSVTFGIGHIVNLLNGAELIGTALQIVYAAAAGYIFTVYFIKSKSIIPCIITHSLVNALSVFTDAESGNFSSVIFTVVLVASAAIIYVLERDIHKQKV